MYVSAFNMIKTRLLTMHRPGSNEHNFYINYNYYVFRYDNHLYPLQFLWAVHRSHVEHIECCYHNILPTWPVLGL